MRRTKDRIVYSPSDLVVFHGSPFASWMDRLHLEVPGTVAPDPDSDSDRLVLELGRRHEAQYLDSLAASGRAVERIAMGAGAVAATLDAMRRGVPVIYQAALEAGPLAGYADFLERVPGASSLGDFHYEVADTKFGASPRPGHLLQLCAYAELLEAAQGVRPAQVHLVLRDGERRAFRTDDFYFAYRRVRTAFLAQMEAFRPEQPPEPDLGGEWRRWAGEAQRRLEAADHLTLVAGMRLDWARKLRAAGIRTRRELATTRAKKVPRLRDEIFQRLRAQARLQRASASRATPVFEVVPAPAAEPRRGLALLPPPSPGDVWFDLEGDPFEEGGLEYLFGVVTLERGRPAYRAWWAHDADGEREALEAFVDWLVARRRRHPDLHVYHYGAYEISALRRLMSRYATREDEVDDLLRGQVFVNLLTVVKQGVRVGTPSYSLKDLEALWGRSRPEGVASGGDSIVAYRRWRESGEPAEGSAVLESIRAYNEDDCASTHEATQWLRARADEEGIAWVPPRRDAEDTAADGQREAPTGKAHRAEARTLAQAMLASVPADARRRGRDPERFALTELLAHLLEFHRREAKPVWWSLFDRDEADDDERFEDPTCLVGLRRDGPGRREKRSMAFSYTFDPAQETRIHVGSPCVLAGHRPAQGEVIEFDEVEGRLVIKLGPKALALLPDGEPPDPVTLLLHDFVPSDAIEQSILATARAFVSDGTLRPALRDLLTRAGPRVRGHRSGPLVRAGEDEVAALSRLVGSLQSSVLCVQGPPGTGKTFAAAQAIAAALRDGRRVAVASNSHAAVRTLLREVAKGMGRAFACLKVGREDDEDERFADEVPGTTLLGSAQAEERLDEFALVGGTAYFFSRPGAAGAFHTLFVDEAGQVSLANLVGMAPCAENLVLVGDPMQLPQPTQGVHPGESGASALDYLLGGHATVPPERGVFLPTTRRLHPSIAAYVSGAFYEDRLRALPGTERRVVRPRRGSPEPEAGVVWVPVAHEGNTQRSDEEVEAIAGWIEGLLGRPVTDLEGRAARRLSPEHVLVVAPYNLQVRALRARLPEGVRVGTVDRFQGQEARVVLVSLTASEGTGAARGLAFVLDPRRLNVAVSRAMSLAYVVGSPSLAETRCASVDDLRLVNRLGRLLEDHAASAEASPA